MSEETLFSALVAFRAECPQVKFDSTNPHFKSKFASLKAIHKVVDPLLAKHHLAVLQFAVGDETTAGCVTKIIHTSGDSLEQEFRVPIGKADAQKACAAVSYARRFGLSGALGIVTAQDVDGNDAVGDRGEPKKPAPKPAAPKLSDANKEKLRFAAVTRSEEFSDGAVTAKEITAECLKNLGLEWSQVSNSNYGLLFAAIQEFEPGQEAA